LARVAIIKATTSGGDATTVRNVLGYSGAEDFKARGGKKVFSVGLTEITGYNLEVNHAALAAAGMWTHIFYPDSASSLSAQLDALVAAHSGQTALVAGSTSQVYLGGPGTTIHGDQVLENVVIDGRTHTTSSIFVENCRSLRMKNVCVFNGNGGFVSGTQSPQVAIVNTQLHAENLLLLGGRGNGGLNCIGKGGTVINMRAGWDSRSNGEGCGAFPGDPHQFIDSILDEGRDVEAALENYYNNANLRRQQPGVNRLGAIGNSGTICMVKHTGGSVVRVEWPIDTPNPWGGLPPERREWHLHWDGWVPGNRVVYLNGNMTERWVQLQVVNAAGTPVSVPAGPVSWFCWLTDYLVDGFVVEGGRFYSPSGNKKGASHVTSYGVRGLINRGIHAINAEDRNIGAEWIDGALYEYNVCSGASGNNMEPVTFIGRDVICRNNQSSGIRIVPNGCPVINCNIQAGGPDPAGLNVNTTTSWVPGWKSNVTHIQGLTMNGLPTTRATCSVPEGSWPGGLIPETTPVAIP